MSPHDPKDDTLFTKLIQEGLVGVEDRDFAEMMGVSTPTVARWKSGESHPYWTLRSTIYEVLERVRKNG